MTRQWAVVCMWCGGLMVRDITQERIRTRHERCDHGYRQKHGSVDEEQTRWYDLTGPDAPDLAQVTGA